MKNERSLSGRTKLLYENDAYIKEFEATVLSVTPFAELLRGKESKIKDKEKLSAVELDQTAFFPEGGGQPCDLGTIGDAAVFDVFKENGIVYHVTDRMFSAGSKVQGKMDFTKRYSRMQNHSGEHLISGLIHSLYGYDNVGFHLTDECVTVDVNGTLTAEDFDRIETLANRAVYENRNISACYLNDPDEMEYRSKIDLDEEIRVIVIDGYDACACCAPHVKTTGEIGVVKIIDVMNHRGGMRFTMLCGQAAYELLKQVFVQNREIMSLLSARREDCASAVKLKLEQMAEQHETEILLKNEITGLYLSELDESSIFFTDTLDDIQTRKIINESVLKKDGIVAGFMKQEKDRYRYIIGKNENCSISLKKLAKDLNEKFSGRGGGSEKMVQGSVTGTEQDLEEFLNSYQ